ncbi:MAG: dipeptide epimerase [Armatimonadetes bacterium]|nr:dipeptide epimerase [Armatimonadota bacterium]
MQKIVAAALGRAEIEYVRPFVIASGPMRTATSVIVALRSEDGTVGIGETTCMTAYTGQTEEGVTAALEHWLLPAIMGLEPTAIQQVHYIMDRHLRENDLAKAAVDIACYDLAGRLLGVPVYELLGGKVRDEVRLAWAVGLGTVDEMVAEAVDWASRGFAIKVKIGIEPEQDLRNVLAIRKAIGDEAILRVDANAGYDVATAVSILPRMEEANLQLIEQPVGRYDLPGMARCRAVCRSPILADESQHTPLDTLNILRAGAADIVNTKIVKPGGLYPSRQVAALAEVGGLKAMVGSMPEIAPDGPGLGVELRETVELRWL